MTILETIARKREEAVERMRALDDLATREARVLTEDEQRQWDASDAEIAKLDADKGAEEKRQRRMAELAAERNAPAQPQVGPAGAMQSGVTEVRDRAAERPFDSLGEQLQAIARAARAGVDGTSIDRRLLATNEREERAVSGASAAVGSDGGFLVQNDFVTEIFKVAHQQAQLAGRCRRTAVSGNSLEIPYIAESSRANGSRYGGVSIDWAGEGDTVTAAKPKLGTEQIRLQKLMGLFYATDELLADQAAMTSIAGTAFAEEFAFVIDNAVIRGSGAGQPLGILNSGGLVTVAKESGQAADTILYENVVNMWSRLVASSRRNAAWYINQDCEPQLYSMSLAVGTGGVPVYLPANGLSGSPYGTLFGRPVIPIEQADTVGDLGDILLLDLSQYQLIDKGGLKGDRSMHVRFLYGEETFRWTYRIGGQPLWKTSMTPANSSNTVSPFVVLAARA